MKTRKIVLSIPSSSKFFQWFKIVKIAFIRWLMHGAKFGVSATFSVIWIYAAELFPTVVRTNALSMGSMAGRIGGIITPFLTGLKSLPWLYPLVFGICCLIASGLIMLLPETAGKSMMTTIEEAEAYYKRRASTISTSIRNGVICCCV